MKVKAFVNGRFPFFHQEDGVMIGTAPTEVTRNGWLDAQIEAGLVGIVAAEHPEKAKKSAKPAEKLPETLVQGE